MSWAPVGGSFGAAAWAAVGLAALAAYVAVRPPAAAMVRHRLRGRLGSDRRRTGTGWRGALRHRAMRALLVGLGLLGVPLLTVRYGAIVVVAAAALGLAGAVVPRMRASRAARRRRVETRQLVVEACEVLAAELRGGRTQMQALEAAARVLPLLRPVAAASRMGGAVPDALRRCRTPGAEALGLLAAAWEAAEDSGAGLADVLDRVVRGLRDDEALRVEIGGQLSAPRATARLLSALPVLGILLGAGVGADPLRILLGTPYGVACLVLGGALAAGGVLWVERLARHAETP